MIVAIVTFKLPKRMSVEEAGAAFRTTAPKYLGKAGLVRKHYYVTEDGARAGGIYLWQSKADAEACYTAEWKAMVTEKYGAPPEIMYAQVPVSVDNVAQRIETS
ncbi:MAG: monooxygenase [Betaproteobacteria bacterium]|nr:MAG: monooxygenase [Betaproteobacteria bacterium]